MARPATLHAGKRSGRGRRREIQKSASLNYQSIFRFNVKDARKAARAAKGTPQRVCRIIQSVPGHAAEVVGNCENALWMESALGLRPPEAVS
jgi:hypothetical protein